MAWTVGNSQSAANQAAATSATVTAPTGIADNDLIIIGIACDITTGGDPGVPTFPAGFTTIDSAFSPVIFHGSLRTSWAWKLASSESGNYTVSWTTSAKFSWVSVDIKGGATSSPVDAHLTNTETASTANITAPALTGLTGSADLLLCLWSDTGGANPYTTPAGMTTILNNNNSSADGIFLGLSYLALSSSANTSAQTVTTTGNSSRPSISFSAAILQGPAAFGDLLGTFSVGKTSVTNPMAAVGTATVVVGDLIVAVYSELTSDTVTGVTDNLGNTYTAQNAGSAATVGGRAFYSRVSVAGTLTTVNFACTASTNDSAVVAAAFSGGTTGFTTPPIDANPANITADVTSPFTCPATGTLAQASELVIAWLSLTRGQTITAATSPNTLAVNQASTTGNTASSVSATIGYQVVAATTTVTPNFTSASGTFNGSVLGTMSFKQAAGAVAIADTMAGAGSLVAGLIEREAIIASFAGAGVMAASLLGSASSIHLSFAGSGKLFAEPYVQHQSITQLTLFRRYLPDDNSDFYQRRLVALRSAVNTFSISASFAGAGLMTAALVELEQIVASFAGSGIMTGVGIPEQFDSSNFNGVGNLAVSLTEIEKITTQFNGFGVLSSDSGVPEQFGSASFNGTGNLGVSLTEIEQTLANLVGVGGLSSSLVEIMIIQTSLAGAGLLTADELGPLSFANAAFVGAGVLQAALTEIEQIITSFSGTGLLITDLSGPQQFDTANFNGVGSLSTSLLEIEQIVASIVGTGSLTTSLTEIEQILVGFSGAGALTANTATPGPSANFNGVGSLVAVATLRELVAATFAAVGALQASTTQRELATAVLNGSGLLAVDLSVPGRIPILATLSGSGSFIASAQILEKAAVSLVGNGVLQSATSLITPAIAIMSAAGSLLTDAKRLTPAFVLFQGTGNFVSNGVLLLPIGTSFSGTGVLGSPNLQELLAVVFSLSGSGQLQVDSVQILAVSSNFAGQGLLLTDVEQTSANSLVFLGEGDLYAKLGHKVQFINDTERTIYDSISRKISSSGGRIIS